MKHELQRPIIPHPTLKEIQERIAGLNTALQNAQTNRIAIENGTFDKREALDLTNLQDDDSERVDILEHLGSRHRILTTRTIPIFERLKNEWVNQLEAKEKRIQQYIQEKRLPPAELPRTAIIFDRIKQDLGLSESSEVKAPEKNTDKEVVKELPQRTFEKIQFNYKGRPKILNLNEEIDDIDYHLLVNLAKRSGTQVSTHLLKSLIQEEVGQSVTIVLSTRIKQLRKWLGDTADNPRLLLQTGTRRGTRYSFSPFSHVELIPYQQEIDLLSPKETPNNSTQRILRVPATAEPPLPLDGVQLTPINVQKYIHALKPVVEEIYPKLNEPKIKKNIRTQEGIRYLQISDIKKHFGLGGTITWATKVNSFLDVKIIDGQPALTLEQLLLVAYLRNQRKEREIGNIIPEPLLGVIGDILKENERKA